MKIDIRQEEVKDYKLVEYLTFLAFQNMEFADGDEHILVANLRSSKDFIPELSLIAEYEGGIVGHILFTSSRIISGETINKSLTLAPVSVHPSFQNQGIGSMLIRKGLEIAKNLGHTNVNVMGHPGYYPKFGFLAASQFGIMPPMEAPEGVFMILELMENSLKGVNGTVQFASEFGV
jgi:predicted N-acetyltransferase YhbS